METTWQLEVTPPWDHREQGYLETTVAEWAHLSHTTPPAIEASSQVTRRDDWPGGRATLRPAF